MLGERQVGTHRCHAAFGRVERGVHARPGGPPSGGRIRYRGSGTTVSFKAGSESTTPTAPGDHQRVDRYRAATGASSGHRRPRLYGAARTELTVPSHKKSGVTTRSTAAADADDPAQEAGSVGRRRSSYPHHWSPQLTRMQGASHEHTALQAGRRVPDHRPIAGSITNCPRKSSPIRWKVPPATCRRKHGTWRR